MGGTLRNEPAPGPLWERKSARLQREPRTVAAHETAVLRGPLLRAAIHFAKSRARRLQGPEEMSRMVRAASPNDKRGNGRAKLHAANHLSCDNRMASGNHGQAISQTRPICRTRSPHCTPQSQPTEGQRKCGTCLGGGMCSGSGDSQKSGTDNPTNVDREWWQTAGRVRDQ